MINRIKIKRPSVLPKNAKRVFKGNVFEVYQWPQKVFDGSTRTFEMLKRDDAAVAIPVTPDDKLVLEIQKQPHKDTFFSFPGGKVEDYDNIDLEALRELKEETGYVPKKIKFWKSYPPHGSMDWLIHIFIAQGCEKQPHHNPDAYGEKIKIRLISFEECLKLAFEEKFKGKGVKEHLLKAYYDKLEREKLEKLFF